MGDDEGRLMVLEAQIKMIATDVGDVKTSMSDMAKSLSTLAVLDVRHTNTAESLARAFRAIDVNNSKIDKIEKQIFASSWVLKVMAGAIGLAGGAVGHTIMSLIRR